MGQPPEVLDFSEDMEAAKPHGISGATATAGP